MPPTTSTATAMVRCVLRGRPCLSFLWRMTLRLPVEPLAQADPQQTPLTALLCALTRLGSITHSIDVRLPPVLPRTSRSTHYLVPLLVIPLVTDVVVHFDPGIDGSRVTFTFQGLYLEVHGS